MLTVSYNSLTENVVMPFSFFGWYNQNDGRYLVKATITDKATKTIEQLIFIKTVDIITVYRRYDEQTAIFQCRLHESGISHHDIKLYRSTDGDMRFLIQQWIKQG